MNDCLIDINTPIPIDYTIKIDSISDMIGYAVEVVDSYNLKYYTLSGLYMNKNLAVTEACTFVNNLFDKEILMLIN